MKRLIYLLIGTWCVCPALVSYGAEKSSDRNLSQQFEERLADASLSEKQRLLREWAVGVVAELGATATTADPKFEGVRATGQLVLKLDLS